MVENLQNSDPEQLNLFDLNWYDILFDQVAIYLSIKDLFNLRCCSRTSLEFVNCYFKAMKELKLSGRRKADKVLKFLEPYCKKLEIMHLARCTTIRDEHLVNIVANNTKLRVVNLSHCANLSALSVNEIITKCKNLEDLNVSKCNWFISGTLETLALHQSNVQILDVSRCTLLSECSLTILFRKWDKLKILSLAYITTVMDSHLVDISKNCRLLEHINLTACLRITDNGIEALAVGCENLRSIMVLHCLWVTEDVLAPLRARGIWTDRSPLYDASRYRSSIQRFYDSDSLEPYCFINGRLGIY